MFVKMFNTGEQSDLLNKYVFPYLRHVLAGLK